MTNSGEGQFVLASLSLQILGGLVPRPPDDLRPWKKDTIVGSRSHLVDGVNFSRDMIKAALEQTRTFNANSFELCLSLTKIVKRLFVVSLSFFQLHGRFPSPAGHQHCSISLSFTPTTERSISKSHRNDN